MGQVNDIKSNTEVDKICVFKDMEGLYPYDIYKIGNDEIDKTQTVEESLFNKDLLLESSLG